MFDLLPYVALPVVKNDIWSYTQYEYTNFRINMGVFYCVWKQVTFDSYNISKPEILFYMLALLYMPKYWN